MRFPKKAGSYLLEFDHSEPRGFVTHIPEGARKLFGVHCTPPLGALNSSASSAFEGFASLRRIRKIKVGDRDNNVGQLTEMAPPLFSG
jgi:hypothetical protein